MRVSLMPWWIGTLIGALFLVTSNSLRRGMDITWLNMAYILPFQVVITLGFWYGFRHAPNFITCWFIGSAISGILGLAAGLILFDKHITLESFVGVVLVFCGAFFLARG